MLINSYFANMPLQFYSFFYMGNTQTSKKQSCNVETIQLPKVEVQQQIPKQLNFVAEIQHQNVKNVSQRKSSNDFVENIQPKLSKNNISNKELPPLKIRKSVNMPLTSTNLNEIQNIVQDFQVVKCEKTNENQMNCRECQGNQQNMISQAKHQISSKNIRPKKFRPSHEVKRIPIATQL